MLYMSFVKNEIYQIAIGYSYLLVGVAVDSNNFKERLAIKNILRNHSIN